MSCPYSRINTALCMTMRYLLYQCTPNTPRRLHRDRKVQGRNNKPPPLAGARHHRGCKSTMSSTVQLLDATMGATLTYRCYTTCSGTVRKHASIVERETKMFASEPSTNPQPLLAPPSELNRATGGFPSRAACKARSQRRISCSNSRSRLGSHICSSLSAVLPITEDEAVDNFGIDGVSD